MTDFLFQMGLSNACFAFALAVVAMVVGAKARRPHLAHLLWLLVFVKLVTPPMVTIPVGIFSVRPDQVLATDEISPTGTQLGETAPVSSLLSNITTTMDRAKPWLASLWLLGSVVVFLWSLVRVCRFSRLLAAKSEAAPQALQTIAERMADRLGLNTVPTICATSTRLSPMVWWAGGKVQVVIPAALFDQMDTQESQWILAHELAHVRRRDYLVRWLEWLACVCFWWNPVVWWAQRNLRAMEEICCDDLVLSCLNPKPKSYANSLLSAVEFLARPALRPPAMASEINSGGVLERRFKMIVSENARRSNTRWLQACVLVGAMVVLPLGIASAQDYEAVGKRLRAAVAAGELTGEQARAMLGTLEKEAAEKDQGSDRAKAYLMRVKKDLGAAVEAGEISREDAAKRYEAAEKGIKERMAAGRSQARTQEDQKSDPAREYLIKVRKELGAAVEAGRISSEDAAKRYEAAEKGIKERMAAGRSQSDSKTITREDYARAEVELKKALAEGRTSEEDARARLQRMRKAMAGQGEQQRITREDWEGIKKRIEGAVESGRMTRAEADAKYREIRGQMSRGDSGGDKRAEYEGLERRLRAAVEAGRMTREEAGERLEAYKKSLGQGTQAKDQGKELDFAGISKRLQAAVAAGEMTKEEARAKWEAIKKDAAAKDKGDD